LSCFEGKIDQKQVSARIKKGGTQTSRREVYKGGTHKNGKGKQRVIESRIPKMKKKELIPGTPGM